MEIRLNRTNRIPTAVMRMHGVVAALIKIAEEFAAPAAVNLPQKIERNVKQMPPDASGNFVSHAEARGIKGKQRAVCSAGTETDHHHPGTVHFKVQITVISGGAQKKFHAAVAADSTVMLAANAAQRKFIGSKENRNSVLSGKQAHTGVRAVSGSVVPGKTVYLSLFGPIP